MNKKGIYIAISVFMLSILVTFVDAIIKPNYFIKIPIKVIFFLAIPMTFFALNKKEFKSFKSLFSFKREGISKSLLLGILVYVVILCGYFLTKNIIDYSNVTSNLTDSMGITATNFIYVFFYISFINSFLEEFFFRGYGFITFKNHSNRTFAYLFSSLLFALYHVGMLMSSFEISDLLLLFCCLIFAGFLFNYLNEKNNNIYPSWFVHMFANFAINTVGFILFGVL